MSCVVLKKENRVWWRAQCSESCTLSLEGSYWLVWFSTLSLYAILRSVPDKLGGVCLMFAAILVLLFVPFLNLSPVRCFLFLPFQQFFFWLLVVDWVVLGWIGACAPEPPFLLVGQIATLYYFSYFFLVLPFVGFFEQFFFFGEKTA